MKKEISLKDFSKLIPEKQKEVVYLRNRCFQQFSTGDRLVICDLDDVLFYTNFIFEEIESIGLTGEEKWDYFHKNVRRCPINYNIYCFLTGIESHVRIIFLTARSEAIKLDTFERLFKVFDTYPEVIFRKENDYRESWEVKEDVVKSLIDKFEILFALDDDIKNCEMYARHGIPVLHVINAEGRMCSIDTKADKTLAITSVKSD